VPFFDKGKVYSEKVYQILMPTGQKRCFTLQRPQPDNGERITAAIAVPDFGKHDFCLATLKGRVKRVDLEEFSAVRPSGMIAMSLDEGDELAGYV
jgi:DNA gyrase subunit A